MPAFSADKSRGRYLAFALAVAIVAIALFLVTRVRANKVQTLLASNLTVQAQEVLVLLDEAKNVCMDVARTTLEERRKETARDAERGRFAEPRGAKEDRAVAAGILDLASVRYRTAKRTYLRLTPSLRADSIATDLENLISITRRLCYLVGQPATPLSYEAAMSTKLKAYAAYRARIDPRYLAAEVEREEILARLESAIEGHRLQARALFDAESDATSWAPEEPTALARKSPDEVRAERRELRAEEEWRQRQAELQRDLHRDAIEKWRADGSSTPRAMTTLGLQEVDRDSLTGISNEARDWAEIYRRETGPVTVALRRFDMIRRIEVDERTARACRALFSKVTDLLQSDRLFSSPVETLNTRLAAAYEAARQAAEACLAGDMDAANAHFDRAEDLFARLEADFGLSPG